jgi:hypothetical protein
VVKVWSNSSWNPSQTPCQSLSFWNFCRVLQILPKHYKFYQYKSCPVFRGTQLSCWMTFQILSGKGWKTWSTAVFTVHQHSPATNRAPVSPSSFPTPSPAKPPTGAAQFRPEPPPPWPRDYIASLSFFPGCFSWTRDLFAIETRIPWTCQ